MTRDALVMAIGILSSVMRSNPLVTFSGSLTNRANMLNVLERWWTALLLPVASCTAATYDNVLYERRVIRHFVIVERTSKLSEDLVLFL